MATTLDRVQVPDFIPFKKFNIKEAQSLHLANGAKLHVISAGNQPVAQLELVYRAGVRHETHIGQAYFVGKLLKEGTEKLTSKAISSYFDQYGAFLEIQPGLDRLSVSLFCLTKHLAELIPFLLEVILEATFPEQELEIQKNIKIQNIKVENDKNNVLASKELRATLFGVNHEYGRSLNEGQIHGLERKHLQKFHNVNVCDNLQVLLSGNISEEHIKLIDSNFGQKDIISASDRKDISPYDPKPMNKLIEKPESLQSSIRIGKHIIPKNHKDFVKLAIATEILGGYFGSRLMKNIREEKGYTYGIHASLVNLQQASYLIIGTDVKKNFTQHTIDEIHKEITLLQSTPVGKVELETVKNYMIGTFQSSITSPFSLMDKFKSIHFHGLTYDYYNNYLTTIQAITQEEILEVSNKYFGIASLSEIVVGGKPSAS